MKGRGIHILFFMLIGTGIISCRGMKPLLVADARIPTVSLRTHWSQPQPIAPVPPRLQPAACLFCNGKLKKNPNLPLPRL